MELSFPLPVNHLVLTVNNRLKRHLELLDADARKLAGETIWHTAPIFSINSWLTETYQSNWPDRWVLSSLQSQSLWESLLESDPEFIKLDPLTLKGAAKDAAKAYSLLHQYEITVTEKGFSGTEETRSFYRWKTAYEASLAQKKALDSAHVLNRVSQMIISGKVILPERISLAGFDEITPALKNFIQVLQNSGRNVNFFPEDPNTVSKLEPRAGSDTSVRRFDDVKNEIIQCARWVRAQYREGTRIGIVATRMEEVKTQLERELMAELSPESIFPWKQTQLPFNVSLGRPLIKEPMFPPALTLLSISSQPASYTRLLQVLKSPYLIPEKDDENVVDELETRLIKRKTQETSLDTIRKLTQPASGKNQKTSDQYKSIKWLLAKWIEFQQNKKLQSRKLPSEWARIFSKTLSGIGWPRKYRKLNSREIQAYLEWEKRLDELSTLDPISGIVSRVEAARFLFNMIANPSRPFQEQTTEDSPVQLMGLLESSGQTFDSLWVLGCESDVIPEPLRPNPFIPAGLQRKHELPYASPERQFRFAKKLVSRLEKASQNVVFSYSSFKDKEPKRPSPLLSNFPESEFTIETSSRIKDRIAPANLELFDDSLRIPAQASFLSNIQGGFGILRNQAECPFRAFSIHRLLADRHNIAETDFEHIERGNIIHLALERVWKEIKTRESLQQSFEEGKLKDLVTRILNAIMEEEEFSRVMQPQARFRELEISRVTQLILAWLEFELAREDFRVFALERKDKFNFEGLTIRYRADRIDELSDGSKLLIDYKSGNVKPTAWFKEPVRDPQLPLYAIQLEPEGIALAQVKKKDFKLPTAATENLPSRGLNILNYKKDTSCENWDELRARWTSQLKTLAQNFKNGESQISPIEDEATCRNCHHTSLCRVEELRQRIDTQD